MKLTFKTSHSSSGNDPKSTKALILMCLAFGLVFFLIGAATLGSKTYKNQNWESIDAIITQSEIESYESRTGSSGMERTFYKPTIKYKYTYKNKNYNGEIGIYSTSENTYENAQNITNNYPLNSEVKIKVNPKDPIKNYLEVDSRYIFEIISIALGLTMSIGAGFLYKNFRTKQNQIIQI